MCDSREKILRGEADHGSMESGSTMRKADADRGDNDMKGETKTRRSRHGTIFKKTDPQSSHGEV
jgi:hypothetical protein